MSNGHNNQITTNNLFDYLGHIENSGEIHGIKELSQEDIMGLIFEVKKLALNLARWYSPSNKNVAKSVYSGATTAYKPFAKILENPSLLHPNKLFRKR